MNSNLLKILSTTDGIENASHHYTYHIATEREKRYCKKANKTGVVFLRAQRLFCSVFYKSFSSSSISALLVSGVSARGNGSFSFSYFSMQSFLKGKSSIFFTQL